MNTTKMIILVGLIMSLALVTSSMTKTKDPAPQREPDPAYVIMKRADLQQDQLTAWFEQNHRTRGIYTIQIEDHTYVLLCAGAKPTGGFGLKLESIVLTRPEALLITAKLTTPNPDDMVTMAFTYPNIVLMFPNQTFEKIDMALNEPDQPSDLIQPKIKIEE